MGERGNRKALVVCSLAQPWDKILRSEPGAIKNEGLLPQRNMLIKLPSVGKCDILFCVRTQQGFSRVGTGGVGWYTPGMGPGSGGRTGGFP